MELCPGIMFRHLVPNTIYPSGTHCKKGGRIIVGAMPKSKDVQRHLDVVCLRGGNEAFTVTSLVVSV